MSRAIITTAIITTIAGGDRPIGQWKQARFGGPVFWPVRARRADPDLSLRQSQGARGSLMRSGYVISGCAERFCSKSFSTAAGVPAMAWENRKNPRVNFEHGVTVQMMAIDGTWRRDCTMRDASDGGARLTVNGSLEGLELKEFFLLLSSTGLVYRRCRLVRLQGEEIGIEFIKPVAGKSKARAAR
jgi:hypothetical protein